MVAINFSSAGCVCLNYLPIRAIRPNRLIHRYVDISPSYFKTLARIGDAGDGLAVHNVCNFSRGPGLLDSNLSILRRPEGGPDLATERACGLRGDCFRRRSSDHVLKLGNFPKTTPPLNGQNENTGGPSSGVLLSGSRNSGRRVAGHSFRRSFGIVVEDRREPAFRLLHRPVFASRVVLDLVALDLADAEITTLRVAEIEPAD